MDNIIDGKTLAEKRERALKEKVKLLNIKPRVISILVGNDPPSVQYTKMKQKKAEDVGIDFIPLHLPEETSFQQISDEIIRLNNESSIDGIMIQLPLPEKFSKEQTRQLLDLINPDKDIDGLTSTQKFLPAVVKAVMAIIEDENIEIKNKNIVVLGASNLIGKPVARELEKRGGLVTVINSETLNPNQLTSKADVIVAATGKPLLLKGDMVKDGVVVIDVGAAKVNDKIVGDVEFETVSKKASKITPVPGGVGPMTVICLMENIVSKWEN